MRRGPFRRRFRLGRLARRGRRIHAAVQAVREAHELALSGQTERAARRFEKLAQEAQARGTAHAAQMYLQAGRLYAQAGNESSAADALEAGLRQLRADAPPKQVARAARTLIGALRRHGLSEVAERIQALAEELLAGSLDPAEVKPDEEPTAGLPAKCPYCGATVDPRDLEWLADGLAMCEYCGSMLEA